MKGAIYSRVSTESQDYERQTIELMTYAKKNDIEVVRVFEEKESGFINDRPQFMKLCELTKDDIDIVLVYELSRLSRKSIFLQKTIEEFSKKGINIYAKKENLFTLKPDGTPDPTTQLVIAVVATMAQQEAETMKARFTSGKDFKIIHEGQTPYPGDIYGYKYDKESKRLIIDKNEAKMVKMIFEMSAKGMTSEVIAYNLESMGYQPARSTRWNQCSILGILNKKYYTGTYSYKGHILKVPKIISNKLFEESFRKKDERINGNKAYVKVDSLLRTLITCPYCGHKYQYLHCSNSYACSNRQSKSKEKCHSSRCISATNLDFLVWKILCFVYEGIAEEVNWDKVIKQTKKQKRDLKKAIKNYSELISNREREIETSLDVAAELRERFPNDTDVQEKINNRINYISSDINTLKAYIRNMRIEMKSCARRINLFKTNTENEPYLDFVERKELLKRKIEKIVPYKYENFGIVMVYFKSGETFSIFIKRSGIRSYYTIFDNRFVRFNLPEKISINGSSEFSYSVLTSYEDIFEESEIGTYTIESFHDKLFAKKKLIYLRYKDVLPDSSEKLFKEISDSFEPVMTPLWQIRCMKKVIKTHIKPGDSL